MRYLPEEISDSYVDWLICRFETWRSLGSVYLLGKLQGLDLASMDILAGIPFTKYYIKTDNKVLPNVVDNPEMGAS